MRAGPDVRDLPVDGDSVVVETGRLQDDASRADADRQGEDPEEEPVQHHRDVLPVLFDLQTKFHKVVGLILNWHF